MFHGGNIRVCSVGPLNVLSGDVLLHRASSIGGMAGGGVFAMTPENQMRLVGIRTSYQKCMQRSVGKCQYDRKLHVTGSHVDEPRLDARIDVGRAGYQHNACLSVLCGPVRELATR